MKKQVCKPQKNPVLYLALIALLGGFLNGFLGAGGGIIFGITLAPLCKIFNFGITDKRDIYANAQIAIICISLISLCIHSSDASLGSYTWLILPAALGGLCGSLVLRHIDSRTVGRIFCVVVIWSGIRMLMP